ncbi:MAG: tetratricopeptide repeat protein [Coriobacteriia bacterium]|nr:tetratricopeptide repeat protein [Coriobacteriia bacterium]
MDRAPAPETPETTSRMRALLATNWFRALVVVLAAAIIFGAWAFAESGRDGEPDGTDVVLSLDDEYERARQVAEDGDIDEAIEILERVLAEDPDHQRAAALLRQLRRDQAASGGNGEAQSGDDGDLETGSSDSGSEDSSQPGDEPAEPDGQDPEQSRPIADSVLLAPVGDLASLLPQVISGWERGSPLVEDADATVSFSPANAGAVSRALYSVHDRGSVEGARAFIEDTSKMAYASDGADVRIGREPGYFGTDGARLATAVFARGRFTFEVVVTVPDGSPASARDATVGLGAEFEAAK